MKEFKKETHFNQRLLLFWEVHECQKPPAVGMHSLAALKTAVKMHFSVGEGDLTCRRWPGRCCRHRRLQCRLWWRRLYCGCPVIGYSVICAQHYSAFLHHQFPVNQFAVYKFTRRVYNQAVGLDIAVDFSGNYQRAGFYAAFNIARWGDEYVQAIADIPGEGSADFHVSAILPGPAFQIQAYI
ncbi:MAG: hypothetical protein PWQ97_896 [Tepidanaerobacteraceae bacterium]|nr:hypothetical protein [Tepidanaerobacteraceae bacterium]